MLEDDVTHKYASIFKEELGRVKGQKAKIHLKENATLHFFKPRSVPFAIREKVEQELLQMKG